MRTMYIMLSWVGWIWLAVSGAFLWTRLRQQRSHSGESQAGRQPGPPSPPATESEQFDA